MERINALKITKQFLELKGIKVLTVSQVTLPEGKRTLQGLGLVVYHRPKELITDKSFLDYIRGIVEEHCLNVEMKGIIVDHQEGVRQLKEVFGAPKRGEKPIMICAFHKRLPLNDEIIKKAKKNLRCLKNEFKYIRISRSRPNNAHP